MEIFCRFGFKKTSIEDIAHQAGVGKGTVYLHFESKEALFEAVMRQKVEGDLRVLEGLLAKETSPERKLRVYMGQALAQRLYSDRLGLTTRGLEAAERMIELVGAGAKVAQELRARTLSVLVDILREGRDAGVFHMESLELTAEAIHGVIMTASARFITEKDYNPQVTHTLAELIVRGLKAGPFSSSSSSSP